MNIWDKMKPCPICGKEINHEDIYLCGGSSNLIHTCINGIEIKICKSSKARVIDDWNVFAYVASTTGLSK